MLYMVIKYSDDLPEHEYGVNDNYTLVGIYDNEQTAKDVESNYKLEEWESINMVTVECNKTYDKAEEISIGGGYYIE